MVPEPLLIAQRVNCILTRGTQGRIQGTDTAADDSNQ
jgi:hypothetical protein